MLNLLKKTDCDWNTARENKSYIGTTEAVMSFDVLYRLPASQKSAFWTFWIVPVSNSGPGKSPDSLQDGKRPRENDLTQKNENEKTRED